MPFDVKWSWGREHEKHLYEAVLAECTGMPLVDPVNTGILWLLKVTLEHNWMDLAYQRPNSSDAEKVVENNLPWKDTWETYFFNKSTQVANTIFFSWSLFLCKAYQFCSWNVWELQHHSLHSSGMITITVFVYLGLQFKSA